MFLRVPRLRNATKFIGRLFLRPRCDRLGTIIAVYQYSDVPKSVYEGLMNAESHGRYFHQHVRDKSYRYQRMN